MFLAGMSFYVLSDDFLIHQSHQYAEDVRKAEVMWSILAVESGLIMAVYGIETL
jgi:hypothetical protein